MNSKQNHDSSLRRLNPAESVGEPVILRSTANPTIRRWVRMRDNRARRRAGLIVIDSLRLIERAMELGRQPVELAIEESALELTTTQHLLAKLHSANPGHSPHPATATEVHVLGSNAMAKISYGATQSTIVGLFEWHSRPLADLQLPKNGLVLVADRIEKPGNVGAIFRTADAAGAAAVILTGDDPSGRGDPSHPHAIRNSQGAVLSLPTASATAVEAIAYLKSRNYRILAARVESSDSLDHLDLRSAVAIVVGNEAEGLGERFPARDGIEGVHIPMAGAVDSLNVSISAAVILMEAARQRRIAGNDRPKSQNR